MALTGQANATVVIDGGSYARRLVCHTRLPLIACLDSARPAVHVLDYGPFGLQKLGVVDAGAADYPAEPWKRFHLVPSVAWHPTDPRLLITGEQRLRQWNPDGTSPLTGVPAGATYGHVAFSPDGSTVWASPSARDENLDDDESPAWLRSDAFDSATCAIGTNVGWDTAVVKHPGGGLVATLSSNQGATDLLFARPDGGTPARMRIYRHAIILDVDGYEAPVFSPDGRFIAIRGNAYVHSLDVFEFPGLRKVLHTALGDPYPGYHYPPEWLEEQATWSRHNIVFTMSGALLIGTPKGRVIEIDLDRELAIEHHLSDGPIGALAVLSTGHLVLSDRTGRVMVMATPGDTPPEASLTATAAHDRVATFVSATTELSDEVDLVTDLVRTDGVRTWQSSDLDAVTTADDTDPTWLRLRAAVNDFMDRDA